MKFIDEQLAEDSNLGSSFDEEYDVDIHESLIYRYATMRHPFVLSRFTLRFDVRKLEDQVEAVISMYHRAGGMAHIFRHKHHGCFTSNNFVDEPTSHDQRCEVINAVDKTYQCTHWFDLPDAIDPDQTRRRVLLPLEGTLVVAKLNGVTWTELTETTHYTVDYTRGVITLVSALAGGETLHAGFEYDIPVQFETNLTGVNWSEFDILSTQINLIETRYMPA